MTTLPHPVFVTVRMVLLVAAFPVPNVVVQLIPHPPLMLVPATVVFQFASDTLNVTPPCTMLPVPVRSSCPELPIGPDTCIVAAPSSNVPDN